MSILDASVIWSFRLWGMRWPKFRKNSEEAIRGCAWSQTERRKLYDGSREDREAEAREDRALH